MHLPVWLTRLGVVLCARYIWRASRKRRRSLTLMPMRRGLSRMIVSSLRLLQRLNVSADTPAKCEASERLTTRSSTGEGECCWYGLDICCALQCGYVHDNVSTILFGLPGACAGTKCVQFLHPNLPLSRLPFRNSGSMSPLFNGLRSRHPLFLRQSIV